QRARQPQVHGEVVTPTVVAGLPESGLQQDREHTLRTAAGYVRELHAGTPVVHVHLSAGNGDVAERSAYLGARALVGAEHCPLRSERIRRTAAIRDSCFQFGIRIRDATIETVSDEWL